MVDRDGQPRVVSLLVPSHHRPHSRRSDRGAEGGGAPVTRVMGLFDSREALLAAIDAVKGRGLTIVTAFLPAYDAAVIDAAGVPRAWSGRIAFIRGLARR